MSDQTSLSAPGLVDTHCHLDAAEFDQDRDAIIQMAVSSGVQRIVIPAIGRENFDVVAQLCDRHAMCVPAYGIHPLYVDKARSEDLDLLRMRAERDKPVAIGEIGLDFYHEHYDRERQEYFFVEQLKIARDFDLPVILHVRRAVDDILKHLRRIKVKGGIAHAFNGSRQQADILLDMGFKLGFGGAMTWERARHIRELAQTLPLSAIVLETDAPDIPPEWIGKGRNTPAELPRIAGVLAELREENIGLIKTTTSRNAASVLPGISPIGN